MTAFPPKSGDIATRRGTIPRAHMHSAVLITCALACVCLPSIALAQDTTPRRNATTKVAGKDPSSLFRPIGNPSAYSKASIGRNSTGTTRGSDTGVRQVAYMQGPGTFAPPPLSSGTAAPAPGNSSAPGNYGNAGNYGSGSNYDYNQAAPALQSQPSGGASPSDAVANPLRGNATGGLSDPASLSPAPSTGGAYGTNQQPLTRAQNPTPGGTADDYAPMTQPRLQSQWATTGNCALVTPPSGYSASFWGCGPPVVQAGAYPASMPYAVVPATTMPNSPAAMAVSGRRAGLPPIFTLGQENYNVQLGQGIIGQPVAYVPGQPVRNVLRYIFP